MISVFSCVRHIHSPHPGRNLTVRAKICYVKRLGADRLSIQLKRESAIIHALCRIAHRCDAAVKLYACTIEIQCVRRSVHIRAGKSKILILCILHMFHPSGRLVCILVEAAVVRSHLLRLCLRLISKIIRIPFSCPLIYIFLYRTCSGAAAYLNGRGNRTLVSNHSAVDSRLAGVCFLDLQRIDCIVFCQIAE